MKAYRNLNAAMFFHASSNIQIEDSIFADNGVSIDLQSTISPPIRLKNITIIGESDSFRTNVRTKYKNTVCSTKHTRNATIGVEIRTFKNRVGSTGSIWNNINFSGFNHNTCNYSSPISLDYMVSKSL